MNLFFGYEMKDAKAMALDVYQGVSRNSEFTAEDLRVELNSLIKKATKDWASFQRNKLELFEIIQGVMDVELPKRIESALAFADVVQFGLNEKPEWEIEEGEFEAVAVAHGVSVRRERLTSAYLTFSTEAFQVKTYEYIRRIQAGLADFNKLVDKSMDAMEKFYYAKVQTALEGAYTNLQATNKKTGVAFVEGQLDELVRIASSYGTGKPVIYGTSVALAQLPIVYADASELAKREIETLGRVGQYKGKTVVELPNVVKNRDNTEWVWNDQLLYIIPGGNEKIVKVAQVGGTLVRDTEGKDSTINFEVTQEAGVGVLVTHNFCIYENTAL